MLSLCLATSTALDRLAASDKGPNMSKREIEISFENCAPADASQLAQHLEDQLREVNSDAELSLKKDRADSQDFGTTLVLLFGTPVAVALASGVAAFLQRYSSANITITENGQVIAKNLDSRDAAKIAEVFASIKFK